jgi:hypothetical protein
MDFERSSRSAGAGRREAGQADGRRRTIASGSIALTPHRHVTERSVAWRETDSPEYRIVMDAGVRTAGAFRARLSAAPSRRAATD